MSNKQIELRFKPSEIVSDKDGNLTVSGYVNKYDEPSAILGTTRKFIEKISKGAFSKALGNTEKHIDFLAEHDSKKLLASTKNNSLTLKDDEQGLYMEATITPTSWGKDTYELIKSGLYSNMSFGFKVVKDEWKKAKAGLYERTIKELDLFEVSVVKDPAYSSSIIEARGIDVVKDIDIPKEIRMEETNMDQSVEERLNKLEESMATAIEGISTILSIVDEKRAKKDEETEKPEDEKSEGKEQTKDENQKPEDEDTKKDDEKRDDSTKSEDEEKDKEDRSDEEDEKKEDEKKDEKRSLNAQTLELRNRLDLLKQEA